jgi:hypothetical protein
MPTSPNLRKPTPSRTPSPPSLNTCPHGRKKERQKEHQHPLPAWQKNELIEKDLAKSSPKTRLHHGNQQGKKKASHRTPPTSSGEILRRGTKERASATQSIAKQQRRQRNLATTIHPGGTLTRTQRRPSPTKRGRGA